MTEKITKIAALFMWTSHSFCATFNRDNEHVSATRNIPANVAGNKSEASCGSSFHAMADLVKVAQVNRRLLYENHYNKLKGSWYSHPQ